MNITIDPMSHPLKSHIENHHIFRHTQGLLVISYTTRNPIDILWPMLVPNF